MIRNAMGENVKFDMGRAKKLAKKLEKIALKYPEEEFGEALLTVWGYSAAINEIKTLRKEMHQMQIEIERLGKTHDEWADDAGKWETIAHCYEDEIKRLKSDGALNWMKRENKVAMRVGSSNHFVYGSYESTRLLRNIIESKEALISVLEAEAKTEKANYKWPDPRKQ